MLETETSAATSAVESVPGFPLGHPVALEVVKAFVALNTGYAPGEALKKAIMAHARKRLGEEFGVDVPEADAPKRGTLDACVSYLEQALRQRTQA